MLDIGKLQKIAALINDASCDEATRTVAELRLKEAFERDPVAFRAAIAEMKAQPSLTDVAAPEPEPSDYERDSFFRLSNWSPSSRNPNNICYVLTDDEIVTVFGNRNRPGLWSWSFNRNGDTTFSRGAFPSKPDAVREAWAIAVAPRRRRGRT
jgi:hypothetical protein